MDPVKIFTKILGKYGELHTNDLFFQSIETVLNVTFNEISFVTFKLYTLTYKNRSIYHIINIYST